MLKVVGYCRVSTNIQIERESIEVQENAIIRFCNINGLTLTETIKDEGVSGTTLFHKREGGKRVIQLMDMWDVDGVVFTKLDRAFRNVGDAVITIDKWNKQNQAIFILNFMNGVKLDSRDPVSKAMLHMVSVFSQLERDMISERVRQTLEHKKETNQRYCKSVYGYKDVNGSLVPDWKEQQAIKLMVDLRLQGYSLRKIASLLEENCYPTPRGAKHWYASSISEILSNSMRDKENSFHI